MVAKQIPQDTSKKSHSSFDSFVLATYAEITLLLSRDQNLTEFIDILRMYTVKGWFLKWKWKRTEGTNNNLDAERKKR